MARIIDIKTNIAKVSVERTVAKNLKKTLCKADVEL